MLRAVKLDQQQRSFFNPFRTIDLGYFAVLSLLVTAMAGY